MRQVSNDFKDTIKEFGKEINVRLTIKDYSIEDDNITLLNTWIYDDIYEDNETEYHLTAGNKINSVSFSYDGRLYSSIMKQCYLDINKDTYPSETGNRREIKVEFGLLVNNSYEYTELGTFYIKEVEDQKDSASIKITMYDKLLFSMVQYDGIEIETEYIQTTDTKYQEGKQYYSKSGDIYTLLVEGTDYEVGEDITGTLYEVAPYSITLRDYTDKLATHIGLDFYNKNETFPNYDRILTKDLYLDSSGASLGYTFRDVLDDISEATGRTFIIKDNVLKLISTPTSSVTDLDEASLKDIKVDFGEKFGPINALSLSRSADSDIIYRPLDSDTQAQQSIETYGKTEIRFKDNQLLSQDDRGDWIDDIYNEIFGTEYYINDYSSPGIVYLEPLDRYSITIDSQSYNCLMLSDEINITQGLEENIHSDSLEKAITDYSTASITDKTALQTTLIVDKQLGQIIGEVASKTDVDNLQGQIDANGNAITSLGTRVTQTEEDITFTTSTLNNITDDEGNVTTVKNSLVTINSDGIQVQTNTSAIKTQMTNDAFIISDTTGQLARFDDDGANLDNLTVDHYLTMGVHRVEKFDNDTRTGFFYVGG